MVDRTLGMVLGKFMPPHAGHSILVNFARAWADEVIVVVGTLANEPIAGQLRFEWMTELFPDVTVVHLPDELPQHPDEHPEFWSLWQHSLKRVLPKLPTHVFASEFYGHQLAGILDATFVPADPDRVAVDLCATAVRADPWRHFADLPAPVRAYYLRRICVFGPESTGKSTLAARLAKHYATVCVPEYARVYLEARGREPVVSDMAEIARGQLALERALLPQASHLVFTDTDVLTTAVWSQALFRTCDPWISRAAAELPADLTLLLDVDVPWVADEVRYLPGERASFFERCVETLDREGRRYEVIRGSWQQRWQTACAAVDRLCDETGWTR